MGEFDDLYEANVAAVFRHTLKCVGRRDVAEDITSEVFLELYRRLDSLDRAQVRGWLFAVAKNRAIDYWRRTQLEQRYLDAAPGPQLPPEALAEGWLRDAKTLKPIHRACLILHYVHGMKRAEIAKRLGLSETQVKGHVQYALASLRREWQRTPC
jgi:RNA polymerase sigma-70 factor (ECF subfamily)